MRCGGVKVSVRGSGMEEVRCVGKSTYGILEG